MVDVAVVEVVSVELVVLGLLVALGMAPVVLGARSVRSPMA